jgi:hypothetical protein
MGFLAKHQGEEIPSGKGDLRKGSHKVIKPSSKIAARVRTFSRSNPDTGTDSLLRPILDFQVLQSAKGTIVGYQNGFGG